MLYRKIEKELYTFYESEDTKALMITGARQVGKTTTIEETGKKAFKHFIEINFIENEEAKKLFQDTLDTESILIRISALANQDLVPNETLIFFDEVQVCKEIVTEIKFLVKDGRYKYILSGSLLGTELQDIRSFPVGYMDILQMYPLDLEEFAMANGVSNMVMRALRECFMEYHPVDSLIHEKMMELFRLYLIVGGMPNAVNEFLKTNDLRRVNQIQQAIVRLYKKDITQYDPNNKFLIEDIFDLIPSELNAKNKRFIMKNIKADFKFKRYYESFLWLKNAGVALPVYSVSEPKIPLLLSKQVNYFKLFLNDVGLLASMSMDNVQIKILKKEKDINFGSIYENMAAQELSAHGFDLYYFNSKKQGELDFVMEENSLVVPIEIKSGKDYKRHHALSSVLNNSEYEIEKAYVFYNGNVEKMEKILYLPIYMLMFIEKEKFPDSFIYKPNLDVLK